VRRAWDRGKKAPCRIGTVSVDGEKGSCPASEKKESDSEDKAKERKKKVKKKRRKKEENIFQKIPERKKIPGRRWIS
jgi:hypothetical protein